MENLLGYINILNINQLVLSLIAGFLSAVVLSFLGVFVIIRRMALVTDAFSHIALPGLALGLLFHFNPLFGALGILIISIFLINWLEEHTKIKTEALVGVVFCLSLALGVVLTPEHHLIEALFGDIGKVQIYDIFLFTFLILILIGLLYFFWKKFAFLSFSSELAKVSGLNVYLINLLFLFSIVLGVVLGIKIVGTLLVGSLMIIPPATARIVAYNLKSFLLFSCLFGSGAIIFGIIFAHLFNFLPGPMIVLTEGIIFFFILLVRHFISFFSDSL